jgi:hypothetical protein
VPCFPPEPRRDDPAALLFARPYSRATGSGRVSAVVASRQNATGRNLKDRPWAALQSVASATRRENTCGFAEADINPLLAKNLTALKVSGDWYGSDMTT